MSSLAYPVANTSLFPQNPHQSSLSARRLFVKCVSVGAEGRGGLVDLSKGCCVGLHVVVRGRQSFFRRYSGEGGHLKGLES
jgi:hypothetical protein